MDTPNEQTGIDLEMDEILRLQTASLKTENLSLQIQVIQGEIDKLNLVRQQMAEQIMTAHGIRASDYPLYAIDMQTHKIVKRDRMLPAASQEPRSNGLSPNSALSKSST